MTRPSDYTPIIPGTQGWTDDMLPRKDQKLEDSFATAEPKDAETYASPAVTRQATLEERVDHLEKMHQLLWKAIHELTPRKD